jgi:hypothetical protein
MKKQQLDHILRAAGQITGQKQFVIVGSQALHGKYPNVADTIVRSAEVDLFAPRQPDATELLNEIGVDSPFHTTHGFYADPVDETTAVLPKGWKGRLVNLPAGETGGVTGLCLEPHDLAISKYVARRDKDRTFTRELARRGLVDRAKLRALVDQTPVTAEVKERIRGHIESDFASSATRGRAPK